MATIKNRITQRVLREAEHIKKTKQTIRQTASIFGVSKSTVHKDISERLKTIDINLYKQIEIIMNDHIETRHIKGGESTKQKYCLLRNCSNFKKTNLK